MSDFTSISTDGTRYPIKLLDDGGKNFQTWAMRMELILQAGDIWDVVDPTSSATPMPSMPGQLLDDWNKKDKKALIQIKCSISNTAILSLKDKIHTRDAWTALSECYNGIGTQDAAIISSKLHRFIMDDSKLLEPQINTMREYRYQLASFSDPITDSKFAMILSESLPPSYETLKTVTVASVSNISKLATDTLIAQILREEKRKQHQSSATLMIAKTRKANRRDQQRQLKLNATKSSVRCTNPKCGQVGHSFEQCWAEGGGSKGKKPKCPRGRRRNSGMPKELAKVATSPDSRVEILVAHSADPPSSTLLTDGLTHNTEWIIDSRATVVSM